MRDRDGLRARQPARRARRRRRRRAERARRRAVRGAGRAGHEVASTPAATTRDCPRRVPLRDGVDGRARRRPGRPAPLPKDELLPYMGEFGRGCAGRGAASRPDVVHAHFWMSGLAALGRAGDLGVPVVQTFHALGSVKRRHQGAADTSPPRPDRARARAGRARRPGRRAVPRRGARAAADGRRRPRIAVVPCGVDLAFPARTGRPRRAPRPRRLVASAGWWSARASTTSSRALRRLPGRRAAWSPAGPRRPRSTTTRRRGGCAALAARPGVADRVTFVGAVGRDEMPALVPLGRRGGRRALVRAVRHRAAGGDGVRRAGGRHRGRRAHRHRGRRRHRRAACRRATRGRCGRGAARGCSTTGMRRLRVRRGGGRAGPRALRLGPGRRRDARARLRSGLAARRRQPAPVAVARDGSTPAGRLPIWTPHLDALRRARSPRCGPDVGGSTARGARELADGSLPAAGGCWSPATAAAPPRPSTSPPSWSAATATSARRCRAIAPARRDVER